MEEDCDICGKRNIPGSNYCGYCGVDLKEDRSETPYHPKKSKPAKKKRLKKTESENEKITWCVIVRMMRSFNMDFPNFLLLSILLAEGKQDLGFCDCHLCSGGYRELYAYLQNRNGKKNLKHSSREVVIKSLESDIPSLSFNIPELITPVSKLDKIKLENEEGTNKISIEIEAHVLEDILFSILSSERGLALIRKYSGSES
jgi:hypothetical protein